MSHRCCISVRQKQAKMTSVETYTTVIAVPRIFKLFLIPPTNAHKRVTIIVEITNKLLRHVSTQEVSSSGSSLVLAKITYEYIEMCKLCD